MDPAALTRSLTHIQANLDGNPSLEALAAVAGVIANVQAALGMQPVDGTSVTIDSTPTHLLDRPEDAE